MARLSVLGKRADPSRLATTEGYSRLPLLETASTGAPSSLSSTCSTQSYAIRVTTYPALRTDRRNGPAVRPQPTELRASAVFEAIFELSDIASLTDSLFATSQTSRKSSADASPGTIPRYLITPKVLRRTFASIVVFPITGTSAGARTTRFKSCIPRRGTPLTR